MIIYYPYNKSLESLPTFIIFFVIKLFVYIKTIKKKHLFKKLYIKMEVFNINDLSSD
jgi:hypothetical protein